MMILSGSLTIVKTNRAKAGPNAMKAQPKNTARVILGRAPSSSQSTAEHKHAKHEQCLETDLLNSPSIRDRLNRVTIQTDHGILLHRHFKTSKLINPIIVARFRSFFSQRFVW